MQNLTVSPHTQDPLSILTNVPLADKNWFRTGGAAQFYGEPATAQEFISALDFAQKQNLPIFVLGQGANILISDDGFDGLVIRPALKELIIRDIDDQSALVTAGAGVIFGDLIDFCIGNNLIGLEEFSGIPGTVGGSVFINIHYFEFLLQQFLVEAQVIEKKTGMIHLVDNSWFAFGYDYSKLHTEEHYLLNATFKLTKVSADSAAYARGRSHEIIRHRHKRYPITHTCGSFFRNFYPDEVTLTSQGKKLIFAAYYLDKVGVKGVLCHGDAIVSYQHANMIVNRGKATSADIIAVARAMQERVQEQFGVLCQPECQLIGFNEYPLL